MALPERAHEGEREEEGDDEQRDADDEDRLGARRHEREDREVADEEPVGPRIGDDDAGVGRLAELRRSEDAGENEDDRDEHGPRERVAPHRVREVRDAVEDQRFVARLVGPIHGLVDPRGLADAALHDQVHVEQSEEADDRRDEEDVRRVDPRQGRAADAIARDDETGEPVADERRAGGLFGADHERPERVLIPAEGLAGEGHERRREEKQRAGQPVDLAGVLVRAHEEHARHMGEQQEHHRARAEPVDAADDAAVLGLARRANLARIACR